MTDPRLPIRIEPTIAMQRGDSHLALCMGCGALVCSHRRARDLGPCPSCGRGDRWQRTRLPSGPFRESEETG